MSEVDRFISMSHRSNIGTINKELSNEIKDLVKASYK